MIILPFKQLSEVENVIDVISADSEDALANLVLILTKREKDEYLLFYNSSLLPIMPIASCTTKHIDALNSNDLLEYNGVVIGFAALDVIFPYVPTHGSEFYSMYHIFEKKKKYEQYVDTSYHLAAWLWTNRRHFGDRALRGIAKIIEMALPKLLKTQDIENLVAVIPNMDLAKFLNDQNDGMQLIALEDLDSFKQSSPDQWIITFEELAEFIPIDPEHYIDLRIILRHGEFRNRLQANCLSFANYFWIKWKKTSLAKYRYLAYALASEAWLMNEDVEDLIAFIPHSDFKHFIRTGDALRIDRIPHMNEGINKQRYTLHELTLKTKPRFHDLEFYQGPPVTFSVLSKSLHWLNSDHILDLGSILHKAGHRYELARTYFVFSSDLLKYPVTKVIDVSSSQITDIAKRAMLIYSLGEPWAKRWRARYVQLIGEVYKHVWECLLNQENLADNVTADYFAAVKEWYGINLSGDIPRSINNSLKHCRDFLEKSTGRDDLSDKIIFIKDLMRVMKILLGQDSGHIVKDPHKFLPHFEVIKYLENISSSSIPLKEFSAGFDFIFNKYEELHNQWHSLRSNFPIQQPAEKDFRDLLEQYAILQKVAYAPMHELNILKWACQHDVEQIDRWRNAYQRGPILRIRILNNRLLLEKRERLFVEIENIGEENGYNLNLALQSSNQFDFVTDVQPFTFQLDTFETGHVYRIDCDVRPLDTSLELPFSYRFFNRDSKMYSGEETIPIEIVKPKVARTQPNQGTYFQAGPPVCGEYFFGRKTELREILNYLLTGILQPILLRGPRRIGKSSILKHLEYILTKPDGEIYLSRLDFTQANINTLRKIHPVITSLQRIEKENFIARWFQRIYMDICKSIGDEFNKETLKKEFDESPYGAFEDLLGQLFERHSGMRLLIMIDEWDEQRHLADIGSNLRDIMQREQRVNWIVSSTWTLRQETGKYGSPFYSQTKSIELKEMKWDDAENLIIELSDMNYVDWQSDARIHLLDRTARRPYLTQLLCQDVITYLRGQSLNLVDREVIASVINEFIKSSQSTGQPFAFLWESELPKYSNKSDTSIHSLGRLILWALDTSFPSGLTRVEIMESIKEALQKRNLEPPNDEFLSEEFNEQMVQLEQIFDVIRAEGTIYKYSIPLAQQWFHFTINKFPDPIGYVYGGLIRDYNDWKRSVLQKEAVQR